MRKVSIDEIINMDRTMIEQDAGVFTLTELAKELNRIALPEEFPPSGKFTKQFLTDKIKKGYITPIMKGRKKVYDLMIVQRVLGVTAGKSIKLLSKKEVIEGKKKEEEKKGKRVKDKLSMTDSEYLAYEEELQTMLESDLGLQQATIRDKFWTGTAKVFKLKTVMGEFIDVESVIATLNKVVPNVRDMLYKIPPNIATKNPSLPPEIIQDIHDEITEILKEFQRLDFE